MCLECWRYCAGWGDGGECACVCMSTHGRVKGRSLVREGEVTDKATKKSGPRSHPAVMATVILLQVRWEPLMNFKQRSDISDIFLKALPGTLIVLAPS